MGEQKTIHYTQILIQMPNLSQEPPASSKAQKEDFKDMDVLCTFKINWESQNSDHGYVKDHWSYLYQDQDAKPQQGTSSVLRSPKWRLKVHICSLHLQNQDRELKFGSWVNQGQATISKSRSRCQTPARNLQHPPKSQMRTLRTWMFFAFKIKIESQYFDHGCTKDHWTYANQYQDAKPQSGTSRVLQSPKSEPKWHGYSLHLQNQDR